MPAAMALKVIEAEFGGAPLGDLFEWIDLERPLGAASVAQVHKARLRGDPATAANGKPRGKRAAVLRSALYARSARFSEARGPETCPVQRRAMHETRKRGNAGDARNKPF